MAFEGLSDKLSAVFKRMRNKGKLKESDIKEAMREVRLALLEADVNYKVTKEFVANVTAKAVGDEVLESLTPAQMVIKIVNDELTTLMGESNARLNFQSKPPTIVMMCGLQGSGKTTHSAKLALHFKGQGKRPLLVACDIYRPAAIDQLKVVGERAGVPVFEMGQDDPVEIARRAVLHAKDHGNDLVILDTAGRLHIDETLMGELQEPGGDGAHGDAGDPQPGKAKPAEEQTVIQNNVDRVGDQVGEKDDLYLFHPPAPGEDHHAESTGKIHHRHLPEIGGAEREDHRVL